ncbi:MAG: peptide chain release factor N(5)-glutamine methyltransferase [Bacteroidaceae bacterium]|nr:peptide chain release factor N(5)-glutamine methyltransferase [Bacteroidaceae bacterium]
MASIIDYICQTLQPLYSKEEAIALTRIIYCEMLEQTPTDFFLGKDIVLSSKQKTFLRSILQRLLEFEPIQYIQQQAPFCNHRFYVAPGVLIPRPETEELVLHLTEMLPTNARVFDIGTGSGCIAISLSLALPQAVITACDISEKALTIAETNNERLQANVSFFQTDILTYKPASADLGTLDAIVSNPPYITRDEAQQMEPNVLRYEPHEALFVPNDNPLLFYREIGILGLTMLKPGGILAFEINRAYGKKIKQLLETMCYEHVQLMQDICHNDRFIFAKKQPPHNC